MVAPISSSPERLAAAHSSRAEASREQGWCRRLERCLLNSRLGGVLMAIFERSFLSFHLGFGAAPPSPPATPPEMLGPGVPGASSCRSGGSVSSICFLRFSARPRALTATSFAIGHALVWVSIVEG